MVCGRYNELVHGVYKPTNITGGHHHVHHNHKKKLSQLFFSGVPRKIFGFQKQVYQIIHPTVEFFPTINPLAQL